MIRDATKTRFALRYAFLGLTLAIGVPLVPQLSGCARQEARATSPPPPAEVVVSRPLTTQVQDTIDSTGVIAPLEEVEVRARVTGFLEKMYFTPRDWVKKDQLLFTIDPRPFEMALSKAEADHAALRAQLAKAENDVKKVQDLYDRGVSSADERIDVISKRDALAAQIAAAYAEKSRAELNLEWCSVKAPIDGRITRNLVDVGNLVSSDTTVLARIVNDAEVYAYYDVSEQDALRLRARASETGEKLPAAAKSPSFLGRMTDEGFPFEGHVDYADPSVRPSTGTIQVRSRFKNPDDKLLPGLFARVRCPVSKPYVALAVSERALGSDQGQRFLLVVNSESVVEYRPVKVGRLENGLRIIESGINADDRVITIGLQRVRPGITVKPVEQAMPVGPATKSGSAPAPASAPDSKSPATAPPTHE